MRPDHLGDAVMATAALAPLAEALEPEALDVLCGPWAADVFARLPEVTRVLPVALPWWMAARGAPWLARVAAWGRLPGVVRRLRANRYDVVIDLRGDLRHLLVAALTGASERVSTDRTGGVALCTRIWPFDQRPHEVEKTMSILATLGVRRIVRPKMVPPSGLPAALLDRLPPDVPLVVLALCGTEPNRTWPVEHAATLAAHIVGGGARAVLVGGPRDVTYARRVAATAATAATAAPIVDLVGATSVEQLAAVMARAVVAVCVDSGPMHVAAAVGTPVIALFGAGDPQQSRPWASDVVVLGDEAPCGCVHPWCDRQPSRTAGGTCLEAITPDTVARIVMARLGGDPVDPAYFPG
jgi:ADP-heptose:LPS heptosyltransferase